MARYSDGQESVGCPLFLGKLIKNWYKDYDLFYDHFSESIIFHSNGKFYIQYEKLANEPQKILKFNIGTKFERIFACGLNHDGTMLACQPTYNTVYVFNNSQKLSPHGTLRKQYEIEEYKFEYKGISKILGFSFANSTYFNFFICTNNELELLNFNKFSSNVVHVKKIPISGMYLLYELHFYNILIVVGEDGATNIVDLNMNPRTKNVIKKTGKFEYEETVEEFDDPTNSRASARMSFGQRALSIFKAKPIEKQFDVVEPINNKNILMISEKNEYLYNAFSMKESNQAANRYTYYLTLL